MTLEKPVFQIDEITDNEDIIKINKKEFITALENIKISDWRWDYISLDADEVFSEIKNTIDNFTQSIDESVLVWSEGWTIIYDWSAFDSDQSESSKHWKEVFETDYDTQLALLVEGLNTTLSEASNSIVQSSIGFTNQLTSTLSLRDFKLTLKEKNLWWDWEFTDKSNINIIVNEDDTGENEKSNFIADVWEEVIQKSYNRTEEYLKKLNL